jgi:GNAT superfamily N-acetyltransferase
VVALGNLAFGDGYFDLPKIKDILNNGAPFYTAYGETGDLIGYCCSLYLPMREAERHMKLPENAFAGRLEPETPVCFMKSMAIAEEYKGKGLADRLFASCLADAVTDGLRFACSSAWKIGDSVPMRRIFQSHGFVVHSEIPMLWFDDKDYTCVVCKGSCRCSGVIYYKFLNGKDD